MSGPLSYADAVRLLGGGESKIVSALDKLTGGALLAAPAPVAGLLGLFKADFIRLSHDLVREFAERRSGLSRYHRSERLAAAHQVLVVTAYFEALAEADLPFRLADLELTEVEVTALLRPDQSASVIPSLLDLLLTGQVPLPAPHQPYETATGELRRFYGQFSDQLRKFVSGLAVWERLSDRDQSRAVATLAALSKHAVVRHRDLLGKLATDFPEVAFWIGLAEHQGTRDEVRALAASLAGLQRLLEQISTGQPPDARREDLARAYTALLRRGIVESGDVPAGLAVPTLGAAYRPPRCRVAELAAADRPSDESWWSERPIRDDLPELLVGQLTAPGAVRAPLLVLGQPGSGKSVLTKVLAARLPAADFLPVRVVLRDVPAAADLQEQIEYAIRDATGERLEWPALARSAGDALPVVLLDGFDELLQATGVSQTDYLRRVAAFQRREADQGRPVVVIVTSRTSVADRAQAPEGTVAVRLEPFDEERITGWLDTWNEANAANFEARGVTPLDTATVLAHRELAEQPLLLLMLALYDADGNALRDAGDLRRDELYERLLRRFARREVIKHRPGLPERELDRAVEEELRRLSVVAFAMFNRSAQWVTEADLEADLAALVGVPGKASGTGDLRAPLRPAEVVLGRFFFVHRAQASRDGDRLETYEFLHATFGEFLVARLTWRVLGGMVARESAADFGLGSAGLVDDDLLHALLSYASLSGRAPILGFLQAFVAGLDSPRRAELAELLIRLYQAAHHTRPARRFDSYQPRGLPVPARHAAYSVNLLLLAVCAAGTLPGSRLYPGRNVVPVWHRETLLWRSQLSGGDWQSLVDALALDRIGAGDQRDVVLRLDDGSFTPPPIDLDWTYGITRDPAEPERRLVVRSRLDETPDRSRRAHFECGIYSDVALHALAPLTATLPWSINTFLGSGTDPLRSFAHVLLDLLLVRVRADWPEDREAIYRRGVNLLSSGQSRGLREAFFAASLLLDTLANDREMSPAFALEILTGVVGSGAMRAGLVSGAPVLRCALAFLGHDRDVDRQIANLVRRFIPSGSGRPTNPPQLHTDPVDFSDDADWLPFDGETEEELRAEVRVRLHELDLETVPFRPDEYETLVGWLGERRPDLVERIRPLVDHPSPPE